MTYTPINLGNLPSTTRLLPKREVALSKHTLPSPLELVKAKRSIRSMAVSDIDSANLLVQRSYVWGPFFWVMWPYVPVILGCELQPGLGCGEADVFFGIFGFLGES